MTQQHFARTIPYDRLVAGLDQAVAANLVTVRHGPDGLMLYKYTNSCVYDRGWNDFSMVARGLILDPGAQRIVATPFPKFFNLGEVDEAFPDEPFEVYEKLDGSLIILFHHKGRWNAVTRGSFESAQGRWAQDIVDRTDLSILVPGTTYLAEAVYPENRIVVKYDESALVFLGAYDAEGFELPYADIVTLADRVGWRAARRYRFDSAAAMVAHADALPADDEGYVVQFASGLRLKVKGAEYRRVHALISNVTPLGIWNLMNDGDDLDTMRRVIPEELWYDFDTIRSILTGRLDALQARIRATVESVAHLDDKQLGLSLQTLDPEARRFVFTVRKNGDPMGHPKSRQSIMQAIRPDANRLDGYEPSHKMRHFVSETTG